MSLIKNDFKSFEDMYNYIIENHLVTNGYIIISYNNRNIIICQHALDRLNKRFGFLYIDGAWEYITESYSNIQRYINNKTDKIITNVRKLKEKNRYATTVSGVRSVWSHKPILFNYIYNVSISYNTIELLKNYGIINEEQIEDSILVSMYVFEDRKKMGKRRKGK
jgi:hypothetical protein